MKEINKTSHCTTACCTARSKAPMVHSHALCQNMLLLCPAANIPGCRWGTWVTRAVQTEGPTLIMIRKEIVANTRTKIKWKEMIFGWKRRLLDEKYTRLIKSLSMRKLNQARLPLIQERSSFVQELKFTWLRDDSRFVQVSPKSA
jgi:hypothetical protein